MSGISEGGVGFNYAEAFINQSAEKLQSQFASQDEKQQLHQAAKNALETLSEKLQTNNTESSQNQFIELGKKFASLFPEDKLKLGEINNFAHQVLGIEKDIIPVEEKQSPEEKTKAKQSMKEAKNYHEARKALESYGEKVKSPEFAKELVDGIISNPKFNGVQRRILLTKVFKHYVIEPDTDPGEREARTVIDNLANIRLLMNGEANKIPPDQLENLVDDLGNLDHLPFPDSVKGAVLDAKNQFAERYKTGFDYKRALNKASDPQDIERHIRLGADKAKFMNAASELAEELLFNEDLNEQELKDGLVELFLTARGATYDPGSSAYGFDEYDGVLIAQALADNKDLVVSVLSGSPDLLPIDDLLGLSVMLEGGDKMPFPAGLAEGVKKGYVQHLDSEVKNLSEKVKTISFVCSKVDTDLESIPKGLHSDVAFAKLKDKIPGEVFLRFDAANNLVVAIQSGAGGKNEGVREFTFPPSETNQGKFVVDEDELSIEEIVDLATKKYAANLNDWMAKTLVVPLTEIKEISERAGVPLPQEFQQDLAQKFLPFIEAEGSPSLKKVLAGEISALSLDEIEVVITEVAGISSVDPILVPQELRGPNLAKAVLNFVSSNSDVLAKDPQIATRAHHILHELAQIEIAIGNAANAFEIESKAASQIPLPDSHPLHHMDQAILQGSTKQYKSSTGAFFGSLDTSIVKGGHLHASQRKIDGKLVNTFDFKISHYARDELTKHLDAIVNHPDEFEKSLPKDLCKGVTINRDVPQVFIPYDENKNEFTSDKAYNPLNSKATEIVFEGVGKVIIGNTEGNGCMYNRIQVEMDPNLPPGEGAKKLQQMLAVSGLGPVLGQQTDEADDRMRIAQLFRAFYPTMATKFDTKKDFYTIPINELLKEIISHEPGMEAVFQKYLFDQPELMQRVEILPGKEVWGVMDLGTQMRANGAWGLMSGVGNSGDTPEQQWEGAKKAVVRALTEGAMSSEQRFEAGTFKKGASSEQDFGTGGGDQVFTRLINDTTGRWNISSSYASGNAQILWDLESVAQRVPYGYDSDNYGVKNRFNANYGFYEIRPSMLEMAQNASNKDNEVMVKNSIAPQHVAGVVVNSETRKKELIEHLEKNKLAEKDPKDGEYYVTFAGKKIKADDFIHVGANYDKKWWG